MVGVLFLVAMWLSPLASVIPAQATAPALIIVGFYMMSVARDIPWDDFEEAIPAFTTMLVMPFTWSITNGIGAGFVTYVAIKLLNGRGRYVHWMLYVAAAAFVVYFAIPFIERRLADLHRLTWLRERLATAADTLPNPFRLVRPSN